MTQTPAPTETADRNRPLVTAVIGNPKPDSRTHRLAIALAGRIAEGLGGDQETVDLATGDDEAVAKLEAADIVIAASPTYKATYSGLLKSCLDQLPYRGLAGKVGIGLMISASELHLYAAETYLRPLLVELGTSCPVPALAVTEPELAENGIETTVDKWWTENCPTLERWFS
jgi:FMN reductase